MTSEIGPDDNPTPERIAEWQDMIESLRDLAGKELGRYDREFLDGIDAQLSENKSLTVKQREYLESLHANYFG